MPSPPPATLATAAAPLEEVRGKPGRAGLLSPWMGVGSAGLASEEGPDLSGMLLGSLSLSVSLPGTHCRCSLRAPSPRPQP